MNPIEVNKAAISRLCVSHKVKNLYAFGSILTDQFNHQSDIDLIVDFEPLNVLDYADNYFDLKFALQDILKRPVDLLEANAITNPFFKNSINQQKKLIYGQ
ncbi:MAG TPA: nucleotidyltransferase domain-containing protein [Daejeonella sp.]|nr:nucleotidyltransferase domain-containing protein [Daejeonella sp.]